MSTDFKYEKTHTLLKVSGVNLDLGGRKILRDVNLEIKDIVRPGMTQGQIVGLLGPSGMGKTQLFRILSGLNVPDSGTVDMGNPLTPVQAGRVGVVAQDYPLFHNRTVMSNLVLASKQAGRTQPEEDSKKMLDRFDLGEHGDKFPAQLSGGQRQRVAIAQQLLCSEMFLLSSTLGS